MRKTPMFASSRDLPVHATHSEIGSIPDPPLVQIAAKVSGEPKIPDTRRAMMAATTVLALTAAVIPAAAEEEPAFVNFVMVFTVPNEKQARFDEVTAEQRRISATEEGTVLYETFQREDGTYLHLERYADEAALLLHIQNTAALLQEWQTIVEIQQILAAGPLSNGMTTQFGLEPFNFLASQ